MLTLNKSSAMEHCLTCLLKLDDTIEGDFKHFPFNINTNVELKLLLSLILEQPLEHTVKLPGWPQYLCCVCYQKLQNFKKFRRRAKYVHEKLLAVLQTAASQEKIEYEMFDMEQEQNASNSNVIAYKLNDENDIYNAMLKNALLETESVLLEHTATTTTTQLVMVSDNDGLQLPDPDPFNMLAEELEEKHSSIKNTCDTTIEAEEHASDQSATDTDNDTCGREDAHSRDANTDEHTDFKANTLHVKRKAQISETYTTQSEKSNHPRRNRGYKNIFKCLQCNHNFAHKITLDAHVRKIHEGSKRPFKCDRCDKSYTFIGGLYTHIKEIHDAAVRSYACDYKGCERVYTSFIAMQKHKRLKHSNALPENKKYVCEQCGATFNQSGNLKYHRRTKHPTEAEAAEKELEKQNYFCDICQKQFHSRYTLKYHTLQLHSADDDTTTKYECKICGRRMAKKFMLVQHMLVHSTEKMPCEHCGKQFIRKFELEAHIRAVHMKLKPFACKYCAECFASRKTLRHHEYIHTGEKPYVCTICGQAYRQQTCLKKHRKTHEIICTGITDNNPAIVNAQLQFTNNAKLFGNVTLQID